MKRLTTDILVSGGGIAGMTAACAFASAGFDVICVDPQKPVTTRENTGSDLRSTAFLQPARTLLIAAGIWQHLEPYAAPLQVMRLVDAGGEAEQIREIADFDAADISDLPFGWNLPNWLLRREMLNRIEELPNLRFLTGLSSNHITPRLNNALVRLSDGSTVDCKLVVAADGRNSALRDQSGIGVKKWRYGQKALVFNVSHDLAHQNMSTEIHRSGGPFTLVPLPDQYKSSVVWMETGPRAAALKEMSEQDFNVALNARGCGILGQLTLESRRDLWPIIAQIANRLDGPRTAIIAEAAHVIPPIGAQGLNMSLNDLQCLLDLASAHPETIGSPEMLRRYSRKRWPDIKARVSGVDALNRAAMTDSPNLKSLRLKGLQILHKVTPLRKSIMKAGLGAR